jgi:hypothetical protein
VAVDRQRVSVGCCEEYKPAVKGTYPEPNLPVAINVAERPSKSFLFLYEAVLQVKKNSLNRGRNKFVELNKVPLSLVIRFESYSSDCSLRIPWSIELKFDDRYQFQVVNEDIASGGCSSKYVFFLMQSTSEPTKIAGSIPVHDKSTGIIVAWPDTLSDRCGRVKEREEITKPH